DFAIRLSGGLMLVAGRSTRFGLARTVCARLRTTIPRNVGGKRVVGEGYLSISVRVRHLRVVEATRVHEPERIVDRIRVAVKALAEKRRLDERIGRREPRQLGVVDPALHVDEAALGGVLVPREARVDVLRRVVVP